jgi:hypothetical protein
MSKQPAPDWAIDMAKIHFNPMEERAAFAATSGPRSQIPSADHPPPRPQMPSSVERSLQVPGVALLDAQFDFLDAKEKATRAVQQNAAAAQMVAFEKFMKQAAEFNRLFAEFVRKKL